MIHREGRKPLFITLILLCLLYILIQNIASHNWIIQFYLVFAIIIYLLVLQFFRNPKRITNSKEGEIMAPADGTVVLIEEVEETEYFKDKRIQVSIFMSPLNVHANYNPISGIVKYVKYHKGLFLVAWHPKSSTDNERSTVVTQHSSGKEVLFRQVAGAVARRICYYVQENQSVKAGEEYGFIKFGSRIDLYLPLDSTINVKIGDVVKAKTTKVGKLN